MNTFCPTTALKEECLGIINDHAILDITPIENHFDKELFFEEQGIHGYQTCGFQNITVLEPHILVNMCDGCRHPNGMVFVYCEACGSNINTVHIKDGEVLKEYYTRNLDNQIIDDLLYWARDIKNGSATKFSYERFKIYWKKYNNLQKWKTSD